MRYWSPCHPELKLWKQETLGNDTKTTVHPYYIFISQMRIPELNTTDHGLCRSADSTAIQPFSMMTYKTKQTGTDWYSFLVCDPSLTVGLCKFNNHTSAANALIIILLYIYTVKLKFIKILLTHLLLRHMTTATANQSPQHSVFWMRLTVQSDILWRWNKHRTNAEQCILSKRLN